MMMTTAQAEIREGKAFNPIWIIPLLAIVLGVWMVVHTWLTEGPEITLSFETAEGLTAGKTKVKYRNVEMGVVQEVILSEDFKGVIAKVKLERQALPLLRDDTRFWVVTARISLGNISGLDTLLSGAYIRLAPGEGKPGKRSYTGLEKPPLTPTGAPGLRLNLYSDRAGSVDAGDSVIYRGYNVGRVETMEFDATRRQVKYTIFIDAPFHKIVHSSTRFYNVSGISVKAGADGLQVTTGSMDTVLLGGVTFGVPPGLPPGEPVTDDTEFTLYDSQDAAEENPFKHGIHYVVRFDQSIKGLLPGAPVEYRGIPVGYVVRVMFKDLALRQAALREQGVRSTAEPIPVLIYIEPARLGLPDSQAAVDSLKESLAYGVSQGMRATLESGNLLTGAKYVGIEHYSGDEAADLGEWGGYQVIPTIEGGFDQITVKVNALLEKFNAMPLEDTVVSANSAIAELDKTLASLRVILEDSSTQDLPTQLDGTLRDLQATLEGLAPESPVYENLNATLQQLNRTLGNIESLTRTLSVQPNAAIMPSNLPQDPIPEATR
jgi:paraquat-inducible protein B